MTKPSIIYVVHTPSREWWGLFYSILNTATVNKHIIYKANLNNEIITRKILSPILVLPTDETVSHRNVGGILFSSVYKRILEMYQSYREFDQKGDPATRKIRRSERETNLLLQSTRFLFVKKIKRQRVICNISQNYLPCYVKYFSLHSGRINYYILFFSFPSNVTFLNDVSI
jgi:hypothetical protein